MSWIRDSWWAHVSWADGDQGAQSNGIRPYFCNLARAEASRVNCHPEGRGSPAGGGGAALPAHQAHNHRLPYRRPTTLPRCGDAQSTPRATTPYHSRRRHKLEPREDERGRSADESAMLLSLRRRWACWFFFLAYRGFAACWFVRRPAISMAFLHPYDALLFGATDCSPPFSRLRTSICCIRDGDDWSITFAFSLQILPDSRWKLASHWS